MAKITVVGFVSSWRFGSDEPNPEWGMKVNEPHSKKDKLTGQWVKVGSTSYTVKSAYGIEIDFRQFKQGERVEIQGTLVSEDWEKGDKKGKNLVIKATAIEKLQRGEIESRNVGTRQLEPEYDPEAPF